MSDKMLWAMVVPHESDAPGWVKDMRAYFAQTGSYRLADLRRLLGDPRGYTEVKVSTDLDVACQYSWWSETTTKTPRSRSDEAFPGGPEAITNHHQPHCGMEAGHEQD